MIIRENDKPLCAISYDTKTFAKLKKMIDEQEPGTVIVRILPADFFNNPSDEFQYINLVTMDFSERERISRMLDECSLKRFSVIHHFFMKWDMNNATFGPGCLIFGGLMTYNGIIGKDCIIHGRVSLAEDVVIGDGCFLSGSITIAGDSKIGNFCFLSTNVTIMDHVTISDYVTLTPGMMIRKSISEAGTYYNPYVFEVRKMKNFGELQG